jgi:predicted phage-related endonuclease
MAGAAQAIEQLKAVKAKIKELETFSEDWEVQIRNYMSDNSEIRSIDGSTLVSWKSSKSTKRFDATLFKSAMPDMYEKFVVESLGSRRFLIK